MGFDKSQLNFHGEPHVAWLNKLLQSFCAQVFVSGSPKKINGNFNFIEDHYATGGPMNGILSALKLHPHVPMLVVPVDMPGLNNESISYLLNHCDRAKPATCFIHNNTIEPLPLLLEPAAYPLLFNRFEQGNESLHNFLTEEHVHSVAIDNLGWLQNVNSPWQI